MNLSMNPEVDQHAQNLHNSKVKYYAEFMKRLFFQSKYMSLCKLCEEFLDELLDSINQIVRKQKLILNGSLGNGFQLAPVVEETEEEASDQNDMGVAVKIMKIQEKLTELEDNDDIILDKCAITLKENTSYLKRMSIENDNLKVLLREVKDKLNDMQNKERVNKMATGKQQENYSELLKKFDSMENYFVGFQDNFKQLTGTSGEQSEFDKVRKMLTQANRKNLDLESKLDRNERALREKSHLTENLTKKIIDAEAQIAALMKERDTINSQKNAAEARLKVLHNTVKTGEKAQDRVAGVMLHKDQYIAKLEEDKKGIEVQLDKEKKTSARKLEEINGSLKELTRMAKLKDNEIESLRNLASEYQGESQKLVQSLIDKEKENTVISLKYKELQGMYDCQLREFDETLQRRIDENFANIVTYIEEKEREIEHLRKIVDEKELETNYISEAEGKKIRDMEDVVYNLAKELREKEEENNELRKFIEEYRSIMD